MCLQGSASVPEGGADPEKQETVDHLAERDAQKPSAPAKLTEAKRRRKLRALPGGKALLSKQFRLESEHRKRTKELLRAVERAESAYSEALKLKLEEDAAYAALDEELRAVRRTLQGDTPLSVLLEKHRDSVVVDERRPLILNPQLLSAIFETEDGPRLKEALAEHEAKRKQVWRAWGNASRRRREIELTDPEIVAMRNKKSALERRLRDDVVNRDEVLMQLSKDIARVRQEQDALIARESQEGLKVGNELEKAVDETRPPANRDPADAPAADGEI